MTEQEYEGVQYAVEAYGFLLTRNQQCIASDFAKRIRAYSIHPRSIVIAAVVEKSELSFARKGDGTIFLFSLQGQKG